MLCDYHCHVTLRINAVVDDVAITESLDGCSKIKYGCWWCLEDLDVLSRANRGQTQGVGRSGLEAAHVVAPVSLALRGGVCQPRKKTRPGDVACVQLPRLVVHFLGNRDEFSA